MIGPLAFASYYLHLPLLIVVVSIVYSATRYETAGAILLEAWRWGVRMVTFLVGIAIALYVLAWAIG
jgi:VIT1/CCC1 family predicted Fe2+/Mn2+ transporter